MPHGIFLCNVATEIVLYFMIVFSPWAFGTTQSWSVWTMNVGGYVLGALLIAKWMCRGIAPRSHSSPGSELTERRWSRILGVLTFLVLGYCLVSVLNARANYNVATQTFDYTAKYLPWLPHSYDRTRSLAILWDYLSLACAFWAIVDWLRTDVDPLDHRNGTPPPRLSRLFWVLTINGSLLALQGLLQRADGGAKLLWIMETRINRNAGSQFGPYAYRSNAAQYFNLLWPAILGFWWWLESGPRGRKASTESAHLDGPDTRVKYRRPSGQHRARTLLLPLIVLMALCPIISLSRAGAIVTVVTMLAAIGVILFAARAPQRKMTAIILGVLLLMAGLTTYFDGGALVKRFASASKDLYQGRELTYRTARKIFADYPWFGTGPGSFEHVFQLYRREGEYWPAQLHNDWLETALTFGWIGSTLIASCLLIVLARGGYSAARGNGPRAFVALLWISLGGCLLHARVDFPFQIYSILFLVILLCAVLWGRAEREWNSRDPRDL